MRARVRAIMPKEVSGPNVRDSSLDLELIRRGSTCVCVCA